MCGFVYLEGVDDKEYIDYCKKFVIKRGGDDFGFLEYKDSTFIHGRLAITGDKSSGRQPVETDERIYLFNGEIYNKEFISKILNISYKNNISDTFLLCQAIEKYGLEVMDCFDGPFALIVYEKKSGRVHSFRDHFGEKPLFEYQINEKKIICSDLNIIANYKVKPKISANNFQKLLDSGYLDGDATIFDNVKKTPKYVTKFNNFFREYDEDLDLHQTLKKITRNILFKQSAILLSGGVDSVLSASYLSEFISPSAYNLKISDDPKYDESNEAREYANKLKIPFKCLESKNIYSEKNFNDAICNLNEPIGDPGILNQNYIFKDISKKFKVCYCGTGGDELFHGYKRYQKNLAKPFLKGFSFLGPLFSNSDSLKKIFDEKEYTMEDDRNNYLPNQLFSASDSLSFNNAIELRTPFTSILLIKFWKKTSDMKLIDYIVLKRDLKKILLKKFNINRFFSAKKGFTNDYSQQKKIPHAKGFHTNNTFSSNLQELRFKIISYWLKNNGYKRVNKN